MPHLYVEYTANLKGIDEAHLMEQLNQAICAHATITDEADVKTRIAALPDSQCRIGLHSAGRAFVHAQLCLMAGRSPEVKKALSDSIAHVFKSTIPAQPSLDVQLSVDIADMDKGSYFKGKL